MSFMPIGADQWVRSGNRPESALPDSKSAAREQLAGVVLRAAFIISLLVVMVRVSMPQSESIWTVYDAPGDLIRIALGLAACVWIAVQLFAIPKDAQSHRMWLYLGLAAVPFAVICMVGIW